MSCFQHWQECLCLSRALALEQRRGLHVLLSFLPQLARRWPEACGLTSRKVSRTIAGRSTITPNPRAACCHRFLPPPTYPGQVPPAQSKGRH